MDGSALEVHFIVIPAKGGNPENLAWTEHQGGPGRTVLPIASLFVSGGPLENFRERRDVLLFDQRGVGESQGVHCEALATPRVLSPYFSPESVKACRDEIEARGLLSIDYSTIAAVDDLEAIRERLGYKQLDVGGWSYGSKFMLTYAHRYPERVRTISVFVPTPIDYQRPTDWARFTEAALNGMFDDCDKQPACASAYPNLRDDWERLLEVVEHDPPTLKYTNPYTNQVESVQLTKARLIDEVHVALIRVSRVRGLPHIIHQAALGDFASFMEFAVPSDSDFTPLAEATYLSIVCAEETAFIDVETAEELSQGTFAGLHFVDEFRLACEIWGKPPHPAYPLETQVSDTPILIVAGGRDPITPIEYGERIAEGFLNATLVRIEHMPHHTTGLPGSAECFDRILFEFIEAGSMEGINTACASELKMAAFETGS